MGDMGDIFNAMREEGKKNRERNRDFSPTLLDESGIKYDSSNGDAHLIVYVKGKPAIDFWPGTGLFIVRKNKKRKRGVRTLIAVVREMEAQG